MLFNSKVPAVIADTLKQFQHSETQARKAEAIKRIDYYRSEQDQYTLDSIAKWSAKPNELTPLQINIVRKVINQLACVYIEPARRIVEGGEKDQQLFTDIAKTSMLDSLMKQAQRYAKLLKTVLLRPVWRNGTLEIDLLTGDIVDVATGDSPRDLKSVMVTHWPSNGKAQEVTYSLWTPETFQRLDWRGNIVDDQPNPYGILPFVACWDSLPVDSFWVTGGADLISAQSAINEKLVDLLHVIRWQSFAVGWIKSRRHGPDSDNPYPLTIGPGSFVQLENDPEMGLGFESPQAPIQETWEVIRDIIQQAGIANGLSAHSLTAKVSDESGISKIVSNQELMEKRRDDIELWRRYETQLFDVIKTVWNVHNPGKKFSDKASMRIDFADLTDPDQETADGLKWQQLIDAGQASPIDWAIARNPDLNRETAKEFLIQIRKEMLEFNQEEVKEPRFDFDN
jgi:hypothetical protein